VSRPANDTFAGRMRPAGREFETPGLNNMSNKTQVSWSLNINFTRNSHAWRRYSDTQSTLCVL